MVYQAHIECNGRGIVVQRDERDASISWEELGELLELHGYFLDKRSVRSLEIKIVHEGEPAFLMEMEAKR